MKLIILAAGQGQRLRPLTDNKPKCMVEFRGKAIISHILEVAKSFTLNKIIIIDGYKKEVLESFLSKENITFYTNSNFDNTNMVNTLFYSKDEFDDDIIISYSDIIYKKEVFEKIFNSTSDFSVIVDKKWEALWNLRMENPLTDAETMKIDESNNILELGKKPKNINEIQGQYIGLIKISKNILPKVIDFYENLDKNKIYDGKNFDNMYMTSFIQLIIDNLFKAKAELIEGGWLEIDSLQDLDNYTKANFIL